MTARKPPARQTDEASREGLRLAAEAGDAYMRMVDFFISNVAATGAKKRAGDFVVAVAEETAEPLWHLIAGRLELADPPKGANAHLEVVVMDGADNRFVPCLTVTATVRDTGGHEIGTWDLPFLWHPTMFHYGRSVRLPGDGTYSMTVGIEVPAYPRHDRINGKRYAKPVRAEFSNLKMRTGRG